MKLNKSDYNFKKDKYFRARGGTSVFYNLYCGKCEEFLLLYQKDGTGNMLRLYLDRIFESENLTKFQEEKNKSNLPTLKCTKCNQVIGVPMLYAPEKRLAFRLFVGHLKENNWYNVACA